MESVPSIMAIDGNVGGPTVPNCASNCPGDDPKFGTEALFTDEASAEDMIGEKII